MIRFSRDKVLLLHQLLIAETGGAADVRDFGLLESALESAYPRMINRRATATVLSSRKNPQKVCAGQRIHEYPVLY